VTDRSASVITQNFVPSADWYAESRRKPWVRLRSFSVLSCSSRFPQSPASRRAQDLSAKG